MPVAQEILECLRRVSTATLTSQLLKRGMRNRSMRGVQPIHAVSERMVGEAMTLRNIPAREDLDTMESLASIEHPQRKAFETIAAGRILVIDCRGETGVGAAGDILIARLAARGAAGLVTDGGIRDVVSAGAQGIPVYCGGAAAPPNVACHHAVAIDDPIGCGGVAVFPGDVLVGDRDGVVVVPAHLAAEITPDAVEQEEIEEFVLREICAGRPLFGTYPPNAETLARYRKCR
ncbi:MAG: ribonuclease activity regulator RraA [Burkholderiales bacterium]|nr:ribonuclease activity regulator RraA [Burkholderiales bacterium]